MKMTKEKKKLRNKTIGMFVGLKILEAVGVLVIIFLFYYIGKLSCKLFPRFNEGMCESTIIIWFVGLVETIIIVIGLLIIGLTIYKVIETNWRWAKELTN